MQDFTEQQLIHNFVGATKGCISMCEKLPISHYGAKKIVSDLGLNYEKIDACKNDCMLYYKEHSEANKCSVCQISRWKLNSKGGKRDAKKSHGRYYDIFLLSRGYKDYLCQLQT